MTRRSKRELQRAVGELTGDEYPVAHLIRMLSYDWEAVDPSRNLYRAENDGRVYRWDQDALDTVRGEP